MADAVGTTQTSFVDGLSPAGFRFVVNRLPRVSFGAQVVNIPSLSLVAPEYGTPFVKLPYAGDHIDYGELRVTFLVDEHMSNYIEIHDWLRALGKPDSFDEYAALRLEPGTGVASDCVLGVLDAKRNLKITVTYKEAVPVSLSELVFDSTLPGTQFLPVTATFRYDDFAVEVA